MLAETLARKNGLGQDRSFKSVEYVLRVRWTDAHGNWNRVLRKLLNYSAASVILVGRNRSDVIYDSHASTPSLGSLFLHILSAFQYLQKFAYY